jgi:2-polyprenyl-3-methyl-5-hydroxy-6-metoxy-1,4-benzoquinol methylase
MGDFLDETSRVATESSLEHAYQDKPSDYFAAARIDIVTAMLANPQARVIELGCGRGGTGAAAMAAGKAGYYTGIELDSESAASASQVLSKVICANVETLDEAAIGSDYDVLIMSEVLEHLIDPWAVVAKLASSLKPGALVFASSPSVTHRWIVQGLLRGHFDYQPSGAMDWTHLRWFTPQSYEKMFTDAGFETMSVTPLNKPTFKEKLLDRLTLGYLSHLFYYQIMYAGRKR